MPKLTVGMSHFMDYHGAYFTIQSLRMNNLSLLKEIELVVIDNSPASAEGKHLKSLVEGYAPYGMAGAKYVPFDKSSGTSATRNQIFTEATGDYVLVVDCHVLLWPGAIEKLLAYYSEHPHTPDLLSGPLVMDNLIATSDLYNNQWRSEMWGTWGTAWKCPCGKLKFSAIQVPDGKGKDYANWVLLAGDGTLNITQCLEGCSTQLPWTPWHGHEKVLERLGCSRITQNVSAEPFDIPGQGLGLFTCRRDKWLGFNEHARGFGGEELYIHEKFRRAGARTLCLPFLRWVHRFARPEGVKYPITQFNKVRNYVLEFNELGMDLEPIHQHFVGGFNFPEAAWKKIVTDPIGVQEEGCRTCGGGKGSLDSMKVTSLESTYELVVKNKRDLEEHLPYLRELASKCNVITEVSKRRESAVAFLASRPQHLHSYNTEHDQLYQMTVAKAKAEGIGLTVHIMDHRQIQEIYPTDLLFIDSIHTYTHALYQLNTYAPKVSRFIVFHDTQLHGEVGEDGNKPGLLGAIRDYLRHNEEWSVIKHFKHQYGLTVLGRMEQDKPKIKPGKIKMAASFAAAITKHVVSGSKETTPDEFEGRLEVCSLCEHRNAGRCSICGCTISEKAKLKTQDCPIALWPKLES